MTSLPLPDTDADAGPPVLRLTTPQDLIRAVPYLLGFHPRDSLVMVGLSGGLGGRAATRVRVVARLDLADVEASAVPVESAVGALARARSNTAVALICTPTLDDAVSWVKIIPSVEDRCAEVGLDVASWVFAGTDEWALGAHHADEFVITGPFPHDDQSVIPAAATYAGLVARPHRADLADVLQLQPAERREPRVALLRRARQDRLDCSSKVRNSSRRSDIRAIFSATRALAVVDDEQIVRFGAALADIAVRDACWLAVESNRIDGEDLWAGLSRALPDEFRAAPLFLFGWQQWRAGRGALASIAVEEALRCDPTYSAAELLGGALTQGLDPFRTPRLKKGA